MPRWTVLILILGMGSVAYRRRRDGILEIVHASRRPQMAIAAGISLALLGTVVALTAAHMIGIVLPVAVAGLAFLATCAVRHRRTRAGAPSREVRATPLPVVEVIRKPPARKVKGPALAPRERLERPPHPPGSGAVVISIPGIADARHH